MMASDTARLSVSCVKTQVEGFDREGFMTVNTNTVVQKLSHQQYFLPVASGQFFPLVIQKRKVLGSMSNTE